MASCLLLLLPALAAAKITIEISGDMTGDERDMRARFSGQESNIISDAEIKTFQLSDKKLKMGAKAHFGRKPEDIFVRGPTPWGDLFRSYRWQQTTRTLRPIGAKILKISLQPQIVKSKLFESNCTTLSSINVALSQKVQNSVTTSWRALNTLTVGQNIVYKFDIGTNGIDFESPYGTTETKSESVTIGSTSGMRVLLRPEQAVISQLQATRGTMHVEIEYEASISGKMATNFGEKKYNGSHFWSMDVEVAMKAAGLPNKMVSKEVIKIDLYESKVVVYDRELSSPISACRPPCLITR